MNAVLADDQNRIGVPKFGSFETYQVQNYGAGTYSFRARDKGGRDILGTITPTEPPKHSTHYDDINRVTVTEPTFSCGLVTEGICFTYVFRHNPTIFEIKNQNEDSLMDLSKYFGDCPPIMPGD